MKTELDIHVDDYVTWVDGEHRHWGKVLFSHCTGVLIHCRMTSGNEKNVGQEQAYTWEQANIHKVKLC